MESVKGFHQFSQYQVVILFVPSTFTIFWTREQRDLSFKIDVFPPDRSSSDCSESSSSDIAGDKQRYCYQYDLQLRRLSTFEMTGVNISFHNTQKLSNLQWLVSIGGNRLSERPHGQPESAQARSQWQWCPRYDIRRTPWDSKGSPMSLPPSVASAGVGLRPGLRHGCTTRDHVERVVRQRHATVREIREICEIRNVFFYTNVSFFNWKFKKKPSKKKWLIGSHIFRFFNDM